MANISAEVITAAQNSQRKYGVPASVSIAQFGLESAWGTKMPKGSNNPFGIKAKPGQPAVVAGTTEVYNGKSVGTSAPFRKYANFAEAFDDHGALFQRVSLYSSALVAWKNHDLAQGVTLMAKHYATDPSYAAKILSIIRTNNLAAYDAGVVVPVDAPVAPASKPVMPAPAPAPTKWDESGWFAALLEALLSLFGRKK